MTGLAATPRSPAWLLLGPVLFLIAVVLGYVSNAMVWIGPIDRATFGWAIVIPLMLVSPVIAGIAARWTGERATMAALLATSLVVGIGFVVVLAGSIDRIGCEPVSDVARRVGHVLPVGIAAAAAFAIPGGTSLRLRARPARAVIAGVALSVLVWSGVLLVFAATFPGVTCVPVPS